jgi:hypothetical protein
VKFTNDFTLTKGVGDTSICSFDAHTLQVIIKLMEVGF